MNVSPFALTHARLLEVLSYDPETGVFAYRSGHGKGGCLTKDGYLQVRVDDRVYMAHRVAWFYVHGAWPTSLMDHRNGVRHDNRIANLREATPAENAQNQAPRKGTASRYMGVVWNRRYRKWQAQIKQGGKFYYLGVFDDEESAAEAYIRAKAELHPFQPEFRNQSMAP